MTIVSVNLKSFKGKSMGNQEWNVKDVVQPLLQIVEVFARVVAIHCKGMDNRMTKKSKYRCRKCGEILNEYFYGNEMSTIYECPNCDSYR